MSEDGQRILAADYGSAETGGLVYQSSDGGQMWHWTGSPSANWTALACSADGERVVGVSPQGIFLSPIANPALPSAGPAQIGSDPSGVHMVWQGTPHQTYRLISTPGLDGQAWQSIGAAVADGEGRVSLAEPAIEAQRFWKAMEVE